MSAPEAGVDAVYDTRLTQPGISGNLSMDVAAFSDSIAILLRSGKVSEYQAQALQVASGGLQFCSVGVCVKDFGTVITTDNLLMPGFFDLSLCPSASSVAGCVIARAAVFHDEASLHRSGIPVDITWAIQQYGIKSALCVPIRLPAVTSGAETVASERILGTFTLASSSPDGITSQHRVLSERVAAALAPQFADATSSMYNNITDYVLGPMHGRPYPSAPQPRPLPAQPQTPQDGCWPDESDFGDDDPGMSQVLPVTEADSPTPSDADVLLPFSSLRINTDIISPLAGNQMRGINTAQQHLQSQQHQHERHLQQQQQLHLQEMMDTSLAQSEEKRPDARDVKELLKARPTSQKGGALAWDQHSIRPPQQTSPALAELDSQMSHDTPSRSFSFFQPLSWMRKRSRSNDSAYEDEVSASKVQHALDENNVAKAEDKTQQSKGHVSYKQHWFLLGFNDSTVEQQFCLWQAQQRAKVQLCYSMVVIAVMLCLYHKTSTAHRSFMLWLPPLLQLLPILFLSRKPTWYLEHNELLHVMLNIMKAVYTVSAAVPYPGSFWTPGLRLIVLWKVGLDSIMVSGLGELARFSTFLWVQALNLAIITARSGALCSLPDDSPFLTPRRCMVFVLSTHFLVTYVLVGVMVHFMDKQARHGFVQQHQQAGVAAM